MEHTVDYDKEIRVVRLMLGVVVLGLIVSGLTCYFLPWEVTKVLDVVWNRNPDRIPFMLEEYVMLLNVEQALTIIDKDYPEMMLGTDWLGFAHIILAILFLGAMKDPEGNIWVIQFGLISAALVVPAAWIFGSLRGLPGIHCFIDGSFGIAAIIPLYIAYSRLRRLG